MHQTARADTHTKITRNTNPLDNLRFQNVIQQPGLPFFRGFADFRENEVSESAKKKLIRKKKKKKKIRPNLFLKRQLKLTQTASKLQPRADDGILHLVFALRYEISRDQPVAIVFWVKMPRFDFVRRHEAAFRDFSHFLGGSPNNTQNNQKYKAFG